MNVDGSAQTKVCNCTNAQRPVLSPDGLKIAFEMNNNMYVVNIDGTGLINLTPSGWLNYYASWSPDSAKIVFQSDGGAGGNPSLYRVNINGSSLTLLGEGARPSWSPNGSKIAFISQGSNSNGEVFVMRRRRSVNSTNQLPCH
jgi:TolB protein